MDYRYSADFGNGYIDIPQPLNHSGVKIQIVFTAGQVSASIMSTSFEWVGETAERINAYIGQGLAGGRGIYEGIPLKIEACNQNLGFDLVLDLANEAARFECDRVSCPIKESGRIDWLNDIAGSFNFWYLATPVNEGGAGIISFSDYKKTPYCLTDLPDGTRIATLSISTMILLWQAYSTIRRLIADINIFTGDISNFPPLVGKVIFDIVNIVADIIEIYFVINKIISMVDEIIDSIIQKKKYKLCMRVEDLFKKGCQHLGLQFSSSIFNSRSIYYDTTWMPRKIVQPVNGFDIVSNLNFKRPEDENSGLGNPYGYYDGTFKEFIEDMMILFNAEIRVDNDVLYFEEKHYWNVTNPLIIDNTDEIGFTYNLPAPHGTNASECPSNYSLAFQVDNDELNTLHRYTGTTCTVQVQPFTVGNKKHLLNPPGIVITFPCSLAKRKEYFTKAEIVIQNLIDILNQTIPILNVTIPIVIGSILGFAGWVVNALIGQAFKPIPDDISKRIGWMELSNDSFTIPKIFVGTQVGNDWEVHDNSYERMSAQGLMYWFHGKNLATRGNQYLTYFDKKFKFCCADFEKVLGSNIFQVQNESGQLVYGKFTKMEWDLESEIAVADYRINELFTTNLTERLIIDGLDGNVIGQGGSAGGNGSGQGGGGTVWPQ